VDLPAGQNTGCYFEQEAARGDPRCGVSDNSRFYEPQLPVRRAHKRVASFQSSFKGVRGQSRETLAFDDAAQVSCPNHRGRIPRTATCPIYRAPDDFKRSVSAMHMRSGSHTGNAGAGFGLKTTSDRGPKNACAGSF